VSRARILAFRGRLAAIWGQHALAAGLADQAEWLAEKAGITIGTRDVARIRAWLAMEDGDLEKTAEQTAIGWPPACAVGEALREVVRLRARGLPPGPQMDVLLARIEQDDLLGAADGLRRVLGQGTQANAKSGTLRLRRPADSPSS
jgi:hypothetical protein